VKSIRAARLQHYGGAEAVRVEEICLPEPGLGELLVRVHAAGVNPIDWKTRAGLLREKLPLSLPVTLGGDYSGVVDAVGPGVVAFKAGDEVYGEASPAHGGSGSFAEYVIVPAGGAAPKPKGLSHAAAAALPLTGVSALQALTEHLRIARGQSVLVHGGAGGIGSMAIQMANDLGAHVVTTVRGSQVADAERLGAQRVIDYESQRFEEVVRDLDAVFDTVGGDTYVRSFKVLKRGGRLVSMLQPPRHDLMDEFEVEAVAQFTKVTTNRLARLAAFIDHGALKVRLDRNFPLERASAALQHLEKDSPTGKVVLTLL
jgi:alcohol dehydrogenase